MSTRAKTTTSFIEPQGRQRFERWVSNLAARVVEKNPITTTRRSNKVGVVWKGLLGVAVATPVVALIQGAILLHEYRTNHGHAPHPDSPSRGVVVMSPDNEDQQDDSHHKNNNTLDGGGGGGGDSPQYLFQRLVGAAGALSSKDGNRDDEDNDAHQQPPVRLLVIGDSLAVGVGVSESASPVLPVAIAQHLSKALHGRAVYWTCIGTPGYNSRQIVHEIHQLTTSTTDNDVPEANPGTKRRNKKPELLQRLEKWQADHKRLAQLKLKKAQEWWEEKQRKEQEESSPNQQQQQQQEEKVQQQQQSANRIVRWWNRVRKDVRDLKEKIQEEEVEDENVVEDNPRQDNDDNEDDKSSVHPSRQRQAPRVVETRGVVVGGGEHNDSQPQQQNQSHHHHQHNHHHHHQGQQDKLALTRRGSLVRRRSTTRVIPPTTTDEDSGIGWALRKKSLIRKLPTTTAPTARFDSMGSGRLHNNHDVEQDDEDDDDYYDVAIVLTGLNDVKDMFLPFMMSAQRAKQIQAASKQLDVQHQQQQHQTESLRNNNNSTPGSSDSTTDGNRDADADPGNDRFGLSAELQRVLHALQGKMKLVLPTRSRSVNNDTGKVGDESRQDTFNKEQDRRALTETENLNHGDVMKEKKNENDTTALYDDSVVQHGPLVVFPALPLDPVSLSQIAPLSWFIVPLIRMMDHSKQILAETYPGLVVFVESPSPETFSEVEHKRGPFFEGYRSERVLLKLTDVTQHTTTRKKELEELMKEHYKPWVRDAEDDSDDALYVLHADDVCSIREWEPRVPPGASLISADGIHPNDDGYRAWGRIIGQKIVDEWKNNRTVR